MEEVWTQRRLKVHQFGWKKCGRNGVKKCISLGTEVNVEGMTYAVPKEKKLVVIEHIADLIHRGASRGVQNTLA
jgi:hypothetical protein